jgi:hypothetical protein
MDQIQDITRNVCELRTILSDYETKNRSLIVKNKMLKQNAKCWKRIAKNHEQTISDYKRALKILNRRLIRIENANIMEPVKIKQEKSVITNMTNKLKLIE